MKSNCAVALAYKMFHVPFASAVFTSFKTQHMKFGQRGSNFRIRVIFIISLEHGDIQTRGVPIYLLSYNISISSKVKFIPHRLLFQNVRGCKEGSHELHQMTLKDSCQYLCKSRQISAFSHSCSSQCFTIFNFEASVLYLQVLILTAISKFPWCQLL